MHELLDNEAQLPLLLDLKHAPPEIVAYADKVSVLAKKGVDALDQFQDSDKAIRFDQNPLPPIERDVRDSIKADKQHQLLFGSKDEEFVRSLLISQQEASTYAMHLSKVLSEQETSSKRSHALAQMSAEWSKIRDEGRRLLRNY